MWLLNSGLMAWAGSPLRGSGGTGLDVAELSSYAVLVAGRAEWHSATGASAVPCLSYAAATRSLLVPTAHWLLPSAYSLLLPGS
jgi:hypothetical protein